MNGQYFELVTARDLINYWPSLPIYTWISTFPKMSTHIILCFDPAFEVSKVKTFICFLEHEERRLNKLWIISKPLKYQTRIDSPLRWKPMPPVFIIQASKKSFKSLIAMLKILYWKEHWPKKQETWILPWNPQRIFKQASLGPRFLSFPL